MYISSPPYSFCRSITTYQIRLKEISKMEFIYLIQCGCSCMYSFKKKCIFFYGSFEHFELRDFSHLGNCLAPFLEHMYQDSWIPFLEWLVWLWLTVGPAFMSFIIILFSGRYKSTKSHCMQAKFIHLVIIKNELHIHLYASTVYSKVNQFYIYGLPMQQIESRKRWKKEKEKIKEVMLWL